ncbi:hypothetical protein PHAMO_60005 [Magnetospirillum molischianum DSM 120]|uniref:Uncharacterized protein n=1 Tax=Magnetospirillum molischianum DSM 120 TaxID=1150626 RepID=H8FXU5_MAGML|nr:hypothetical protein PHAMO_60005 [Magnetospirillum molischianum DSM 120]
MEGYNEIPVNGAKTYITSLDLMRLCTSNMWKCSFETLQEIASKRGWDTLRRRYWEEKMISILLKNAIDEADSSSAEKALKAIRGKSYSSSKRIVEDE